MLYNVSMSPSESDDFLQVGAAAEYLGVSPQTLRRWDREGRLTAVRRPGSKYRFYRRGGAARGPRRGQAPRPATAALGPWGPPDGRQAAREQVPVLSAGGPRTLSPRVPASRRS